MGYLRYLRGRAFIGAVDGLDGGSLGLVAGPHLRPVSPFNP